MEEDATWNMLLFLIRNHLAGAPVAISALASVAKAPHATAMRRIHALIERGDILTKNASDTRKRFFLTPSEPLLESFIPCARKIKLLLAETFGLRAKSDSESEFNLGGSYFADQIIPPPRLIESSFHGKREIKCLLNDDNSLLSMRNMWADFRNDPASRENCDLRRLPQLHERVIEYSRLHVSEYDFVAINVGRSGQETPVHSVQFLHQDRLRVAARSSPFRLIDGKLARAAIWRAHLLHHRVARRPRRPIRERQDRFSYDAREDDRRRPAFSSTWERTVRLSLERRTWYACCVNFHVPDGCCGESILRIPKSRLAMGVDEARGEQLRPQIKSHAGLRVLDYLHKLAEVLPPDILEMDWDRRTTSFLSGQAPLAYCWTVRAARFETDVNFAVRRKVTYLHQPCGP